MKKLSILISAITLATVAWAQTLNIEVGNVTYQFPASQCGDMIYQNGETLTVANKVFSLSDITLMTINATEVTDNTVSIVYSGSTASITVAGNIAHYITAEVSGAHVSIEQSSDVEEEITYTLSGTSTDGEFYASGSYKCTVELNNLSLTNTTPVYSDAAVHIQNGKRIKVKPLTGTTNTLADVADGSQKGCLYAKGHIEFAQKGTLNITGNGKHAIKAGEYISIKNATINVLGANGDGISCNEYFLMESGTININNTNDDGIQCDLDGTESTGETADHEDEDSGNIYIHGGTINITANALAAKAIKAEGDMYITDGNIVAKTTGHGKWDSEDMEAKAACALSCDGSMHISGGTLDLSATGSGGKGIKCDDTLYISGGNITIATTGGLYYNNGTTENTNYTGNTDNIDNAYYSSPKGIRTGNKVKNGNSYTYSGGLEISGGTINVSTAGKNAEGIESKNYLSITGGHITVNAYDDGINAGQDINISNGFVFARSQNNDGIDANGDCYIKGGIVYAIGANTPEVAIDANSEERKKLYVQGGTIVAVGDLESGASITNGTCMYTTSWNEKSWYALYNSNELVMAFQTPEKGTSGGGNRPGGMGSGSKKLIVYTTSTPQLMSNVTVNEGVEYFGGMSNIGATVSGGSAVTLSNYTGGGNRPGWP